MIKTSRQLKDLTRNMSEKTGVDAQTIIRNYMMERLLERISESKYYENFILKGGMLVSSIIGIDKRSTMDVDTTVKGIPLDETSIRNIFEEVCSIELGDNVTFTINDVRTIMEDFDYPGVRLSLSAHLDQSVIPLKVDISTNDIITPSEISFSYELLFENRSIPIMSYPIETVLAEKLESILARGIENTRMRDFYDVNAIMSEKQEDIHFDILYDAIEATSLKRGTYELLNETDGVINEVYNNKEMKSIWENYCKNNSFASSLSWEDTVLGVKELFERVMLNNQNFIQSM